MEPTIWRRSDPLGYVAGAGTIIAKPSYQGGLRFQCTRCGNCCGGAPGTVRIITAEIPALAEHLQMTEETFRSVYTRRIGDDDIIESRVHMTSRRAAPFTSTDRASVGPGHFGGPW